jgi:hypothetical protein
MFLLKTLNCATLQYNNSTLLHSGNCKCCVKHDDSDLETIDLALRQQTCLENIATTSGTTLTLR